MLREFQTILNKNIDSTYKADVAIKTGMGVVKDYTNKTADLPTAETAEGIFFVTKERVPTGLDTSRGDISDYDVAFVDVKAGEFVKLPAPIVGERYGTDQYVATGLVDGVAVAVGTDGKWKKAGAAVASRFIYAGTKNDAGHTLAVIEVSATTKTNA